MADKAYARNTDPLTSHEAAASMDEHLGRLEATVLLSLRRSMLRGRTLDELIDDTQLDKVTISPRLKPLCMKGLAVAQGRRLGKSNRSQTVWFAVEYASIEEG